MEDYFNAKLKLFKKCKTGIVNIDHPYGEEVIEKAKCSALTYGIEKDADIKALNIVTNKGSVEFDLLSPMGERRMKVSVPGRFSIYNALAAIGARGVLRVSTDEMAEGLEKISVP
jgi:UDP-N-acetylmuramoyl-L-alanyl-D-glutamate--2,6-diaminopimelate ligase